MDQGRRRPWSLPQRNLSLVEPPKIASLQKYKVIVVGKTGAGKSSFCNFIFGENKFETRSGMEAVTGKAGAGSVKIEGHELYLIDTPGFCDPVGVGGGGDSVIEEIARGLQLVVEDDDPAVDMVVFVISASDRFTEEDKRALEAIEDSQVWSYMLLVFTKADNLDNNDKRQYIVNLLESETCPKVLKELMIRVERRFMIVNSLTNAEKYRSEQRQILMDNLCSLKEKNGGKRYSHQLFLEIMKKHHHLKAKTNVQLESMKGKNEEMQKEIDHLQATIRTQKEEIEQMKKKGLNVAQLERSAMDMEKEKREMKLLLTKKVNEVREIQKAIEESKEEYDRKALKESLKEIIKSVEANMKKGICNLL